MRVREDNTPNIAPEDELMTVHEVAAQLRVDDTTVRRWIKSGALQAITLPHSKNRVPHRIKKSVFNQILTNGIVEPATAE